MSIFSKLFGKKPKSPVSNEVRPAELKNTFQQTVRTPTPPPAQKAQVLWRASSFPMKVVGESHYQPALVSICGPHARDGHNLEIFAVIELEPSNSYDPNAVVVRIDGKVVGYLSKEQAKRVGSQMKEEGLTSIGCGAKVRGGWRTNQHDEGNFGVSLAIPVRDWIDFGTGSKPPDGSATALRTKSTKPKRPEAADSGPLLGEWVVILGAPSDGELANRLALDGAHIMASVGKSTTLLVVAHDHPFTPSIMRSALYRKADERIQAGAELRIVSQSEI